MGECELHKEERTLFEDEVQRIGVCDMEKFGTLDSSEKMIATLGGRLWPQTAKQEGNKVR